MRWILSSTLILLLTLATGCQRESPPGGPGAQPATPPATPPAPPPSPTPAPPDARPPQVSVEPERTFRLSGPLRTVTLARGEEETVEIQLQRGEQFHEDVKLQVFKLPQGVEVEPDQPMIRRGEDRTTITIRATEQAEPGDAHISVSGIPTETREGTVLQLPIRIRN